MDPRGTVEEDHYIHCYTKNMKALGHVVSEKNIFIMFPHCKSKSIGAYDPGLGSVSSPGAFFARFM